MILCLVVLNAAGCHKDSDDLGTNWKEGVVIYSGAPELDGCGWLLFSEGETFSLYNMPMEFLNHGMDVWYNGKELKEYYSCGLAPNTYKIYEIREVVEKPWRVRFLSDYPMRETSYDMFGIDTIFIEGDSLKLHVGYSGGCAIHQFNLWALENSDENPHLMLEHIGNGDMCEAYLTEWLSFSLLPLQEKNKSEVTFMMRGSPIMSSIYGPFTYKY